jgi:RNA polymerase sigma-70 factor, ECF subfamily
MLDTSCVSTENPDTNCVSRGVEGQAATLTHIPTNSGATLVSKSGCLAMLPPDTRLVPSVGSSCPHSLVQNSETDEKLVRSVLERDRGAHEKFVYRFSRLVWSLTVRLLTNHSDEWDDAYQEVWLRLYERLPDWHGGALQVWVGKVATNRLIDFRRKLQRQRVVTLEENAEPTAPPDGAAEQQELQECIRRVLVQLPQRDQQIVLLLSNGSTPAEIVQRLGISRRSFYFRLNKIRKELRVWP